MKTWQIWLSLIAGAIVLFGWLALAELWRISMRTGDPIWDILILGIAGTWAVYEWWKREIRDDTDA